MGKALLLSLLAISTPAAASDPATCGATPFTLKKPVAQAPAQAPKPVAQAPKPVAAETKLAEAQVPKSPAHAKTKITIGCDKHSSK
jgi:hypothetical protein